MISPTQLSGTAPAQPTRSWVNYVRQLLGGPVGAVLGGLAFAAWAAWANRDAGTYQMGRSAAGQFLTSALLTWGDARSMDWLFHRCQRRWAGACCAALGSLIGSYALIISIHTLLATPHILLTLLPGVAPTVAYTLIYTSLLFNGPQSVGNSEAVELLTISQPLISDQQ